MIYIRLGGFDAISSAILRLLNRQFSWPDLLPTLYNLSAYLHSSVQPWTQRQHPPLKLVHRQNAAHCNIQEGIWIHQKCGYSLTPWSRVLLRSCTEENPCLVWNQKVHYHVHKSPPWVTTMSQMNLLYNLQIYFPKIHFTIIILSMCRSSEWSLHFRLFNQNFVHIHHLSHPCYMICSSHPPWFHPHNIWWRVQI